MLFLFVAQPKLHSNVNDGCLLHQGFLWKRNGSLETRFWVLLFNDSLLFTHVRGKTFPSCIFLPKLLGSSKPLVDVVNSTF
jgi:hypothetical protein